MRGLSEWVCKRGVSGPISNSLHHRYFLLFFFCWCVLKCLKISLGQQQLTLRCISFGCLPLAKRSVFVLFNTKWQMVEIFFNQRHFSLTGTDFFHVLRFNSPSSPFFFVFLLLPIHFTPNLALSVQFVPIVCLLIFPYSKCTSLVEVFEHTGTWCASINWLMRPASFQSE